MWIVPTVITAKCRPKLKFLRYTSWITKMFKIYKRNGGGRRSACILISVLENRVSRSYSSDRQINGDQKGSKWSKSESDTYFEYPEVMIRPKVTNTRLQNRTRPAKSLKLLKGRSGVEQRMKATHVCPDWSVSSTCPMSGEMTDGTPDWYCTELNKMESEFWQILSLDVR